MQESAHLLTQPSLTSTTCHNLLYSSIVPRFCLSVIHMDSPAELMDLSSLCFCVRWGGGWGSFVLTVPSYILKAVLSTSGLAFIQFKASVAEKRDDYCILKQQGGNNEKQNLNAFKVCFFGGWGADEITCHIFSIYFRSPLASLHRNPSVLGFFKWFWITNHDYMNSQLWQILNPEQDFNTFFF